MTRPLRVFGYTMARSGSDPIAEYYPDIGRCSQLTAVVAAKTQKEAMVLFGISAHEANGYMGETGNPEQIETAMSKPGQVFARPIDEHKGPYFEITRQPYVPRPRSPRLSFSAMKFPPRFTQEQLEMIAERFAMANDPVGQSIAEKAKTMLEGK